VSSNRAFDFWYAVHNTEILITPPRRLETFGATTIDYHLVCELMDRVDQVRIREGRLLAYRPEILTPRHFADSLLEGFGGAEADRYLDWLREHEQDLLILKYGFKVRKESTQESVVTDSIDAVLDRVRADLKARDNPLAALVRGVDEPWEVCLVKLAVDLVQRAAPRHFAELREDPTGERREVEQAFSAAARDRGRIAALAALLRARGLFKEYEDRFFAVVRSHGD
jgi:hypothetical protein